MGDLILTTYDWVPAPPRGFVRDLRVRLALEEAGLPYSVHSTSFRDRQPSHFSHQPFGQVPWLTDGDISIFESGAILLHLGELSDKLMPIDPRGRSDVKEWLFAALASVEAASQPWSFFKFSGETGETPTSTDGRARVAAGRPGACSRAGSRRPGHRPGRRALRFANDGRRGPVGAGSIGASHRSGLPWRPVADRATRRPRDRRRLSGTGRATALSG